MSQIMSLEDGGGGGGGGMPLTTKIKEVEPCQ